MSLILICLVMGFPFDPNFELQSCARRYQLSFRLDGSNVDEPAKQRKLQLAKI